MHDKPITLTNLTSHQVELLDHMWGLETLQEVEEWMSTLSAKDRLISQTLMQMVMHEIVEELAVEDLSLANEYLSKFSL